MRHLESPRGVGSGSRCARTWCGLLLAGLGPTACGGDTFAPPTDFLVPPPSLTLDLQPGEVITLTGARAVAPIDLPSANETRTYLIAVQNASDMPGDEASLRVSVRRVPGINAHTAPRPSRIPHARATRRVAAGFDGWYAGGESRFRETERRQLGVARSAAARNGVPPVVGDTLRFRSPVSAQGQLAVCTSTSSVTGVVRAVGSRFAIVEDIRVEGHLTAGDFARFLTEAEVNVAPVSEAYFGAPPDIDGNGRVLAFVTPEVNRLGAAGFFASSDLTAVQECATSNEGEILWLIAPDPVGQFGSQSSVDLIRERLVGVIAHELQHLVHTGRRVFEAGGGLDSGDEPWLNEGLSHIAEEVTGLFAGGLRTGANLDLANLDQAAVSERFRRYHLGTFGFVASYLESTTDVPAIVSGPVNRSDLARARGFGYLFLRWAADQFAADGPPGLVGSRLEEEFFRSLAVGGASVLRSTANIEQALATVLGVNRTWERLFAEYVAAPALDDASRPGVELPPALSFTTWNLPALYENARLKGFASAFPNGFPHAPPIIALGGISAGGFLADVSLLPSTAYYVRLEAARETPLTRFTLSDQLGTLLAADLSIQVTIVRTF